MRVLRYFNSPHAPTPRGVEFGHPGFKGRMRLPQAYRSLPRPSSLPEPSHPLNGVNSPHPFFRSLCSQLPPYFERKRSRIARTARTAFIETMNMIFRQRFCRRQKGRWTRRDIREEGKVGRNPPCFEPATSRLQTARSTTELRAHCVFLPGFRKLKGRQNALALSRIRRKPNI